MSPRTSSLLVLFWLLVHELVSAALSAAEQYGHRGKIHRNPPRFISAEQLTCGLAARLILVIDIRKPLPAAVLYDEGGVNVLDRPLGVGSGGRSFKLCEFGLM